MSRTAHAPVGVTLVALLVMGLSGCLSGPAEEPPPATDGGPFFDWVVSDMPFEGSGRSEGYFCSPARCDVVVGSRDIEVPEGLLRGLSATFVWGPVDPTLDTIEVFLLEVDANLDWSWDESADTYWTGTSPLTITSAYMGLENFTYHLHVRAKHDDPAGAGFRGGFSQTYDVNGTAMIAEWVQVSNTTAPADTAGEDDGELGNGTVAAGTTRHVLGAKVASA